MMSFWDLLHPMMLDTKALDDILEEASSVSGTDLEKTVNDILPRLLSEEMLMQELRVQKKELILFLSRDEVMSALVTNVLERNDTRSFEVLNSPDALMSNTMYEKGGLVRLLTFVNANARCLARVSRLILTYIHQSPERFLNLISDWSGFDEFVDECCSLLRSGDKSESVFDMISKGFLSPEGQQQQQNGVLEALSSLLSSNMGTGGGVQIDAHLRLRYYSLLSEHRFIDRLCFQVLEEAKLDQSYAAEIILSVAVAGADCEILFQDVRSWTDTFLQEAFRFIGDCSAQYARFLHVVFAIVEEIVKKTDAQLSRSLMVKYKGRLREVIEASATCTRLTQANQKLNVCTSTRVHAFRLLFRIFDRTIVDGEQDEEVLGVLVRATVSFFVHFPTCSYAQQASISALKELIEQRHCCIVRRFRGALLGVWKGEDVQWPISQPCLYTPIQSICRELMLSSEGGGGGVCEKCRDEHDENLFRDRIQEEKERRERFYELYTKSNCSNQSDEDDLYFLTNHHHQTTREQQDGEEERGFRRIFNLDASLIGGEGGGEEDEDEDEEDERMDCSDDDDDSGDKPSDS